MAIFPDHATEHTAGGPGTDDAVHGISRADGGDTTSNSREAQSAVEPKIIGPNVPVAGVVDGVAERTDASTSGTSRGTESTGVEKDVVAEFDGHVTGPEKVEENEEEKVVSEEEVDDESKYPKGLPLAILTFGLCMATFVVSRIG